ncbi:D-xylulose kinase [Coprinopsis sp. MPI-PUGE-AT-0042]|nr:D-xylulose kinase [Coprinopsis sp. MPI-PUGE-AT-0042]
MAIVSGPLFLGLDLSTQQLKGVTIKEDGTIVDETSVHFDNDLSHFKTTSGTYHGPGDGEVTSPVEMWLEAIDLLFDRLNKAGVALSDIVAISGAGQQHASVYWSSEAEKLLASLDSGKSLKEQLFPEAFALDRSPIWQDHSTEQECKALEDAVGGAQELADISGSRAYERFTGSQILKIWKKRPEIYEATARISLVSSFVASVFLGKFAPIEVSDASGTNLMDIVSCKWDHKLLEACGGSQLKEKLGPEPAIGGTNLGTVSDWWVKRWKLNPECIVAPITGDNPATIMALSSPGDAVLSLGTSTTFLISIPASDTPPKRMTTSHLLAHPTTEKGQIAMLCYKNGALARENIRNTYANKDWDKFNEFVQAAPPGCAGNMALYFPLPEIIPPGVQGEFCFSVITPEAPKRVEKVPDEIHCRAILESQFLSIRSRIAAILPANAPHLHRLVISGGSSANPVIRQIAADIFGMDVYVSTTKEAAAMGGALLAKYAWWKGKHQGARFEDMTGGEPAGTTRVATTHPDVAKIYDDLVPVYTKCEEEVVQALGN